jgi:amino acid transporter
MASLGFGSRGEFVSKWNAQSGTTTQAILSHASKLGFTGGAQVGLAATIFAMVYCFNAYVGFQWVGYFAGELKNVRRTATISILGAMVFTIVGYCLSTALVYKYFGVKFFGSAIFMAFGKGAAHWGLHFLPYLPSLLAFTPGPQWMHVFIAFCFLASVPWFTPPAFLFTTRNVFAWSFDRLAPRALTNVSDRFHSPVVATVTIGCVVELLNYLTIYQDLGSYLLNLIVVLSMVMVIVSIAALVTPWRRPRLHGEAPRWGQVKVAGVPLITIIGVVSAASWIFVIYSAMHTGFGGTLGVKPMLEAFTAPAIGAVYYLGARLYRKHEGVSLSQTFAEIPPE